MRLSKHMFAAPLIGSLALLVTACGGAETDSPPAQAPVEPPAVAEPEVAPPVEEVVVSEPEAAAPEAEPAVEAEATDPVPETAPADVPAPTEASAPAPATGYAAYTGNAAKGKRIFAQCMTCHAVQEGRNNVGPSLYQIVGRESGTVPGFKYSQANLNSDVVWTEENLFDYLANPSAYIPGTIMAFPGLRNPQDRADLIAYLKDPA